MIRLQKLASILVSFSMLLQLFALPFTPAGTNTALAAPAGPLATPFLPNIPTPVAPQTTEPDVLAQPLTIARAQSTYQATGTAVVTYTLRNTLPPTIRPAAEPGATITDTVAAISATDFAADPNNLRGTQLTLQLTNAQTQFLAASQPADQNGSNLTFNLGDIPPSAPPASSSPSPSPPQPPTSSTWTPAQPPIAVGVALASPPPPAPSASPPTASPNGSSAPPMPTATTATSTAKRPN